MQSLTTKRYGKTMADILSIKQGFFDNDVYKHKETRASDIYRKQPLRIKCKVCQSPITKGIYFSNHGTDYTQCEICGHINGVYDDSDGFSDDLYSSGNLVHDYFEETEEQYTRRLDSIYIPKARFLKDMLDAHNADSKSFKYLDVGAGSGYMVGALDRVGLDAKGIEVDKIQAEFANKMLNNNRIEAHELTEINQLIRTTEADVLVFINVWEHVANLTEMLSAIQYNVNVKYVFFCVPLISLSCAIEVAFPDVFPRHLGGGGRGHTHQFSKSSLAWMYKIYDIAPVAEWYFGTDIMDLFRSIDVLLRRNNSSEDFVKFISRFFVENADTLQLCVDKSGFASDIHVLAKTNSKQNEGFL